MTKMPNKLKIDVPPVTQDEALELMVHHLSLAAAYFEAAPENYDDNIKEIERIMTSEIKGFVSPGLKAAKAWLLAMDYTYNEMKND